MIVSATNLLAQVWDYEGIAFGVGRPEIVATEPDYRNRGLVRAIFELIHARSAAQGQLAQAITASPYYYRQFGYGSRSTWAATAACSSRSSPSSSGAILSPRRCGKPRATTSRS